MYRFEEVELEWSEKLLIDVGCQYEVLAPALAHQQDVNQEHHMVGAVSDFYLYAMLRVACSQAI